MPKRTKTELVCSSGRSYACIMHREEIDLLQLALVGWIRLRGQRNAGLRYLFFEYLFLPQQSPPRFRGSLSESKTMGLQQRLVTLIWWLLFELYATRER
jgi:hypothetical protein